MRIAFLEDLSLGFRLIEVLFLDLQASAVCQHSFEVSSCEDECDEGVDFLFLLSKVFHL